MGFEKTLLPVAELLRTLGELPKLQRKNRQDPGEGELCGRTARGTAIKEKCTFIH